MSWDWFEYCEDFNGEFDGLLFIKASKECWHAKWNGRVYSIILLYLKVRSPSSCWMQFRGALFAVVNRVHSTQTGCINKVCHVNRIQRASERSGWLRYVTFGSFGAAVRPCEVPPHFHWSWTCLTRRLTCDSSFAKSKCSSSAISLWLHLLQTSLLLKFYFDPIIQVLEKCSFWFSNLSNANFWSMPRPGGQVIGQECRIARLSTS